MKPEINPDVLEDHEAHTHVTPVSAKDISSKPCRGLNNELMSESSNERPDEDSGNEIYLDAPDAVNHNQAKESHTYKDLDLSCPQIRPLSLAPAKDQKAAVHCTLRTTSLTKNPRFKALSYTRGDANERHLIFISGRQFQVTPNLYTALLHLRHPDRHQSLWIDAIYINQSDDKEKNHQVLHMHKKSTLMRPGCLYG